MDIYQIFVTHNRMWSGQEILVFGIIFMIVLFCCVCAVRCGKINKVQAAAGLLLLVFLGIVYGSTVFTRSVGTRQYELIPFWSWWEVISHHDQSLLQEDLLNCMLLMPMGVLLPLMVKKKVHSWQAFLAGICVSACIEISQLIFLRGLFEWDDMIHNAFGCMVGCILCNMVVRRDNKIRKKNKAEGQSS